MAFIQGQSNDLCIGWVALIPHKKRLFARQVGLPIMKGPDTVAKSAIPQAFQVESVESKFPVESREMAYKMYTCHEIA